MITRDQAERIAAELAGAPAGDPGQGWELQEFSAGWLVIDHSNQGRRGGPGRVIERETGRVMRFPSFVPPARIIAEYDAVREHGHPDERWPAS